MANPSSDEPMSRREQRHLSHIGSTYAGFLKHLCEVTSLPPELAECAAVSVLHALVRRIQPGEAKDLEAQLPRKLVEFLPRPETLPPVPRRFGREALIESVAEDLGKTPAEAEPIVRTVFAALRGFISEGEAEDVERNLPRDLQELWRRPQ